MGRANNLQTDELVAVEVEKYWCLYDKSYPGYKEKDRVINAWKAVDDSLGMEEGAGKRLFDNFKKRYSKKRMNYKKATRSGAGSSAAKAAEKELKDYDFLAWYALHVRLRQTQTNLESTAINENEVVGDDNEDLMTNDLDRELDTDVPGNNDDEFSDANISEAESNICAKSIRRRKREAVASSQNKRKNNSITSTHTSKKSNVATMELEVMDRIGRAIEKRNSFEDKKVNNSSEDMDEIFGKMVSCELKMFSIRMKNQVKHEINNVIYKYQNMRDGFTEGNVIASIPPPTNAAHHQSSTHPNPFSSWLGHLQSENL